MYLLLGLLMHLAFPAKQPWGGTDAVWGMAAANLLVGALAWKRPDFHKVITWLVLADAVAGTITAIGAFTSPFAARPYQIRAGAAVAALLCMAWIASGKRSYEVLLPVRGIWAKRLAAGIALGVVQIVSFSGFGPRALIDSQKRNYIGDPMDLMSAGAVCTLTLILYLFPAWQFLSKSTPRRKRSPEPTDVPGKGASDCRPILPS